MTLLQLIIQRTKLSKTQGACSYFLEHAYIRQGAWQDVGREISFWDLKQQSVRLGDHGFYKLLDTNPASTY